MKKEIISWTLWIAGAVIVGALTAGVFLAAYEGSLRSLIAVEL